MGKVLSFCTDDIVQRLFGRGAMGRERMYTMITVLLTIQFDYERGAYFEHITQSLLELLHP